MSDKAKVLVQKMVDAGEWPDPKLLDEILAQGQEAVGPLLEVVRSYPQDWEEMQPVHHAISLLAVLRPPEAVPVLLESFRHYAEDVLVSLSEALLGFGPQVVEPALALAAEVGLPYNLRGRAAYVAAQAAKRTPERSATVAPVLRELLAECLARAPERTEEVDEDEDDWDEDEDDFGDGDDILIDTATDLVCELAELTDPQGRELIKDAFDARLVDEETIDEPTVEQFYNEGPPTPEPLEPRYLLDQYRKEYREYRRWERQEARGAHTAAPLPAPRPLPDEYGGFAPPKPLHKAERPGRNDPCWCGSGKKYKKCHLEADQR